MFHSLHKTWLHSESELGVGVGGKRGKKEKHLEILQTPDDWKMKVNIGRARASTELVRIPLFIGTVSSPTWWAVLLRVPIAVLEHRNQSMLGRKGLIWLPLPQQCSLSKKVRTGTKQGRPEGGS